MKKLFKSEGKEIDRETYLQKQVEFANQAEGELKGYDCTVCNNKGIVYYAENGFLYSTQCECMVQRKSLRELKKSGLYNISHYTLESYETKNDWQRNAKEKAKRFIDNPKGWFVMVGQVGSGKTHICTAIAYALIQQNKDVRYMKWQDVNANMKSQAMEFDRGGISEYKECEVLYIDDLFKTRGNVTEADIKNAYEIINHRYTNDLITIISSEKMIGKLIEIDEATFSRVVEKAQGNIVQVGYNSDRNYRMKGVL